MNWVKLQFNIHWKRSTVLKLLYYRFSKNIWIFFNVFSVINFKIWYLNYIDVINVLLLFTGVLQFWSVCLKETVICIEVFFTLTLFTRVILIKLLYLNFCVILKMFYMIRRVFKLLLQIFTYYYRRVHCNYAKPR